MSTPEPQTFDRVLAPRELLRDAGLKAIIWSLISAAGLLLVIIAGYLLIQLVSHAGPIVLAKSQLTEFQDLTGPIIPVPGADAAFVIVQPDGLRAVAWADHTQWWAGLVARLYRSVPWLQQIQTAILTLVLVLAAGGWVWRSARLRADSAVLALALDAAGRLRSQIHRQVLRMGPGDITNQEVEQALQLFTGDVDWLRNVVRVWAGVWTREPILLTLWVIVACACQPLVTFYCAVPLGLSWLLWAQHSRRLLKERELTQVDAQRDLRLLAESLTRARLIKSYNMEQSAREHFDKYLSQYQAKAGELIQPVGVTHWGLRLVSLVCALLVAWLVSAKLVASPDDLNLPQVLVLTVCFTGLYFSLKQLDFGYSERDRAVVPATHVLRYLDRIPAVGQAVGAKFLEPLSKSIDIHDVTYGLPDQPPLLAKLRMSIPAGRQVALISTDHRAAQALAWMLPRFLDPQSGQVLFDNEDVAWVTLESLRSEAVYVPGGKEVVFTGTVFENIAAGRPNQTLSDVTQAAKLTHAHNFIQRLPQGYETVIGEHGEALDAGQAFRLALARAVLRDPALLIIEEPQTTLDDDTKSLLDDAYQRMSAKRTVIYLPRRLSTLRRCDDVILLHQGIVQARGTHADLVKNSQLYRHWEYVHFNEFRHLVDAGREA